MMSESAMSPQWDGKREPLYDLGSDEWLLFNDEFSDIEVNDPSLKLTECKTAEQILHDIEELGRKEDAYWLEEFPLFEEIQSLGSLDEAKPQCGQKAEDSTGLGDGSIHSECGLQASPVDLLSASYENSTTFFLSDENILYLDSGQLLNLSPPQSECSEAEMHSRKEVSSRQEESSPASLPPETTVEMAVVDEIVRNTALELDQWESDASGSDTGSESLTGSEETRGGEEEEEETDDPEWRPSEASDCSGGRKRGHSNRSKPYRRGGSQEDKKLRKKEQNKNAATRYRQKKKAEVCEILREEEALREKKARLEERVCDIQNEIRCVKGLMRDLFKAKGFIN